jgi:diguanylate cyclase (GGDEF)-like protein
MEPKKPPRPRHAAQTIRAGSLSARSQASGPRKAFLTVVRSRGDLGKHAMVDGPLILGRAPDCGFTLQDLSVSWQHAQITPEGGDDYVLEDLHSTNGTMVHGEPVTTPRMLHDGEKIVVGETVLRFSLADAVDINFQSEVAMLVGTDPLTGLESKRLFDEALEIALQSARTTSTSLAVLMMDMDGVKGINDTYGHLFGAHVIGETGRLIARHLGARGHACRFGGDEFSAFLPGRAKESARQVAEAIRLDVETAGMEKDGIPLKPTISIGLACFPQDGDGTLDLVAKADAALYRAKGDGKNRVAY